VTNKNYRKIYFFPFDSILNVPYTKRTIFIVLWFCSTRFFYIQIFVYHFHLKYKISWKIISFLFPRVVAFTLIDFHFHFVDGGKKSAKNYQQWYSRIVKTLFFQFIGNDDGVSIFICMTKSTANCVRLLRFCFSLFFSIVKSKRIQSQTEIDLKKKQIKWW
jgi:hypothetical protein